MIRSGAARARIISMNVRRSSHMTVDVHPQPTYFPMSLNMELPVVDTETFPLSGKTIAITGASRGIGRAIALRCAREGANVALLARSATTPSHSKLASSLADVASEVRATTSSDALVVPIDLAHGLDEATIGAALEKIDATFGNLDALVLNASAISIDRCPTPKHYELMMNLNVRSTYELIAQCEPRLRNSDMRHVLSISPPLQTLSSKWIKPHPVYTTSKYAMSMMTIGFSDVLRCNTLWPTKLIRTAATAMLEEKTGVPAFSRGQTPDAFVNAVCSVLTSERTGECLLDADIVSVSSDGVDDIFI